MWLLNTLAYYKECLLDNDCKFTKFQANDVNLCVGVCVGSKIKSFKLNYRMLLIAVLSLSIFVS